VSEPQLTHLTLLDVSDRELLLIVRDHADNAGYIWPSQVAFVLDIGGDHPERVVSSRFSWLKRLGALDRPGSGDTVGYNEHRQAGWRLTDLGLAIATGRLNKTTEQMLGKLDPGQVILLTRWLGGRVSQNGVGRFVDREYRFGRGGRR
jgi:hypothetical protein